nr:MAG TPA: hypothetical protein [Bacteriophage sp.]
MKNKKRVENRFNRKRSIERYTMIYKSYYRFISYFSPPKIKSG